MHDTAKDKSDQLYTNNITILACAVDLGYSAILKSMGNALSTRVDSIDVSSSTGNGDTLRDILAARIAQKLQCNNRGTTE